MKTSSKFTLFYRFDSIVLSFQYSMLHLKICKIKQFYANLIIFHPKIDRPFAYKASINRPFKSTCQKARRQCNTPPPPPNTCRLDPLLTCKVIQNLSMINNIPDKDSYFTKVMKEMSSCAHV